jgi:hypothetical protein
MTTVIRLCIRDKFCTPNQQVRSGQLVTASGTNPKTGTLKWLIANSISELDDRQMGEGAGLVLILLSAQQR